MSPATDLLMKRVSVRQRERERGIQGRFVRSGWSSRSEQSLESQKARQQAYLARHRRMGKRTVCSFVRTVIVKDDGHVHWIPAAANGYLFKLIQELFKDAYVGSTRRILSIVKVMYINGDSRNLKELPRIRVRDADEDNSSNHQRVAAFVGWRFPFVADAFEIDEVKNWLKKNQQILRVSLREAMDICVNTFTLYKKCSNKYLYRGYPCSGRTPHFVQHEVIPQSEGDANNRSRSGSPSTDKSERYRPHPVTTEPAECREKALRIMNAAKDDDIYRSLKIAVDPRCELKFSVLCHVWVSSCHNGKPRDEWSAFEKDLFRYCMFRTQNKLEDPEYRTLELYLKDQLEVFKLFRQSAGLPLYETEEWVQINEVSSQLDQQ